MGDRSVTLITAVCSVLLTAPKIQLSLSLDKYCKLDCQQPRSASNNWQITKLSTSGLFVEGKLLLENAQYTSLTGNKGDTSNTKGNVTDTNLHLDHHKNSSLYSWMSGITRPVEEEIMTELLKFILDSIPGRNIYIFHGGIFPDVSATAATCFRRWAEVTIFLCDEALESFRDLVGAYNQVASPRHIILLCSEANTMAVFQKIRENTLESTEVQWFVILKNHVSEDIVKFVREGTQVTFAVRGNDTIYQYYFQASHINTSNDISLKTIGSWRWNPQSGHKINLKTSLYYPVERIYSNFGGRKLRISAFHNDPFWVLEKRDNQSIRMLGGIDFRIMEMLGKKFNFSFEVLPPSDHAWGAVLDDGRVTGIIGAVHRHESHLGINEITISASREKAVDFTTPYFLETTTILTSAPAKLLNPRAVFAPFTFPVWCLLAVSTLLMGFLVRLFAWAQRRLLGEDSEEDLSFSEITFNIFRSWVIQGCLIDPLSWCSRSLFFSWFFFSLIIWSLYSGVFISVLTFPVYEKPVDSVQDLLDAMTHRGTKLTVECGGHHQNIFSKAEQKVYQNIWALFDSRFGCVKSWDDAFSKVLTLNYALVAGRLATTVRTIIAGPQKFHLTRHEFDLQGYGIACPSGSPYKTLFEEQIIWLLSTGLVQKFTRIELLKFKRPREPSEEVNEAFTIQHLQAGFYLLVVGYFVAAGTFIGEILCRRYQESLLKKTQTIKMYFS